VIFSRETAVLNHRAANTQSTTWPAVLNSVSKEVKILAAENKRDKRRNKILSTEICSQIYQKKRLTIMLIWQKYSMFSEVGNTVVEIIICKVMLPVVTLAVLICRLHHEKAKIRTT
jgi:hypothetical protein